MQILTTESNLNLPETIEGIIRKEADLIDEGFYMILADTTVNSWKPYKNQIVRFDGDNLFYRLAPEGKTVTIGGLERTYRASFGWV